METLTQAAIGISNGYFACSTVGIVVAVVVVVVALLSQAVR